MKPPGNRAGIVIGPSHPEGGVRFVDPGTGSYLVEEGMEVNLPQEVLEDKKHYTFYGTPARVLNEILKLLGHSLADKVTMVKSGDVIICRRSAWDDKERRYSGTLAKILNKINMSKGCNPIISDSAIPSPNSELPSPNYKDPQIEDPNSPRWQKKRERIQQLSKRIVGLRAQTSRDIASEDEKTALTALIIAVMDRTAERVGNDDSADNGHFGVTGFQKKHISVVGKTVHLDYVGKSGMKHEKSFSDERIAKALKKAAKNSRSKFIFETSDGFRIKSDKVNRYLEKFGITAKDIRGYLANRWIVEKLQAGSRQFAVGNEQPEKAKRERKKIFNKALKETAGEVGHGRGTLKKHYMVPELPTEFIEHGRIIDLKSMGYYKEGGIAAEENNGNFTQMKKTAEPKNEECGCFYTFLNQNYPALCVDLANDNINQNPRLRAEMDEAHKAWSGGIVK